MHFTFPAPHCYSGKPRDHDLSSTRFYPIFLYLHPADRPAVGRVPSSPRPSLFASASVILRRRARPQLAPEVDNARTTRTLRRVRRRFLALRCDAFDVDTVFTINRRSFRLSIKLRTSIFRGAPPISVILRRSARVAGPPGVRDVSRSRVASLAVPTAFIAPLIATLDIYAAARLSVRRVTTSVRSNSFTSPKRSGVLCERRRPRAVVPVDRFLACPYRPKPACRGCLEELRPLDVVVPGRLPRTPSPSPIFSLSHLLIHSRASFCLLLGSHFRRAHFTLNYVRCGGGSNLFFFFYR